MSTALSHRTWKTLTSKVRGRSVVRCMAIVNALLLTSLATARADVRILASPGGDVASFLKFFTVLQESGERVIIDGPCYSAYTLILSTIPQDRICITRRAVLGFHAARLMDEEGRIYPAPRGTRLVASTYPAPVRAWIDRRGGLTGKPLLLRGRELAALYTRCR